MPYPRQSQPVAVEVAALRKELADLRNAMTPVRFLLEALDELAYQPGLNDNDFRQSVYDLVADGGKILARMKESGL